MHLLLQNINIAAICIWLAIFIITLCVELSTAQLVSIWFTGGALVSLILACFDVYWVIQLAVFIAVSLILLIVTRPFIKKKLNVETQNTNSDALVSKPVLITEQVSKNSPGSGKIRDVVWTCKTNEDEVILPGEYAIIQEIAGNSLIVTKKGN